MDSDIKTKKTESFGDFEVSSDFECDSCGDIIKIGEDTFWSAPMDRIKGVNRV